MTLQVSPEARRWGEEFFASHRGADVRELLALAYMALQHQRHIELPALPGVGITRQQAATLEFIRDYQARYGASPSYDDIKKAMGFRSKSSVHRLVHGLADRGAISLLPDQARSIALAGRAA